MLLNPRAPFIFGALMILLLAGYLALYHPMPGELASAHAQIAGTSHLSGCKSCHDDASMAAGCLKCHQEINQQLSRGEGYHHFLLKDQEVECTSCHTEHFGNDFQLINQLSWGEDESGRFQHPHVAFCLQGKHEELACEECHTEKLDSPFTLPGYPSLPRPKTFLGLKQDCIACHEDVHAGGLSRDCESCHGQDSFRPATKFDHSLHFPLDGGHERAPCEGCHVFPESDANAPAVISKTAISKRAQRVLPFEKVRGVTCAECHESPHRTSFAKNCEACHPGSAALWDAGREGMTAELHELAGFQLAKPHEDVACEKCHDPHAAYDKRFPDPQGPHYARHEDTCQGCHEDVHGGQFEKKGLSCLACHEKVRFAPHHYTKDEHAALYPLVDAHAEASCESCHRRNPQTKIREFVGTSRECASCHENPHGHQFKRQGKVCSDCHGVQHFLPARYGQAEHEPVYPLEGAHRAVPCISCHTVDAETHVRRFVGTRAECKACHQDPHGGQFAEELTRGDCSACHGAGMATFAIRPFDHEKQTGYPLEGSHRKAKCVHCHLQGSATAASGSSEKPLGELVRRYRGTPRDCSSCHKDVHRGQFRKEGKTACDSCHTSATAWKKVAFDHDKQSRFPLDGQHKNLSCASCHVPTRLPDGSEITQYKPLGTQCENCHEIVPR